MAQEFTIKSQVIEDKINQLLPSQGGFQPGVDFSASTMVIPIVDLTESAEGSGLRQDLQTAFAHGNITEFETENGFTVITSTTGYYRVLVTSQIMTGAASHSNRIVIFDGSTTKNVFNHVSPSNNEIGSISLTQDFIVKLEAGDRLQANSDTTSGVISGAVRQIADINGNLTNP
jgi:hypothetical protein